MPNPTPTLTAEQRADLIGVANAAWEHGAISVSALVGEIEQTIARMVADAEQRGPEAWDKGYTSGHSNAMRRMSDEPNAPTTPNPYRADRIGGDA